VEVRDLLLFSETLRPLTPQPYLRDWS